MIALRNQSIRSSIRTVTLLAALTSLLLTMLTPFVGTAYGAVELEAWPTAPYYGPADDPFEHAPKATVYKEVGSDANPSCLAIAGETASGEAKLDKGLGSTSAGDTATDGVLTVTITKVYTEDGWTFFDFTASGRKVSAVFVKQDTGGAFFDYRHDPTAGDHHLHSTSSNDWSHISFCYDERGGAEIVKKDAPGGNTLTGAEYTLYKDSGADTSTYDPAVDTQVVGTCTTPGCSFNGLVPGTYWAVETAAPAWYHELSGADAVKKVVVVDGQTTTVEFVNAPIPVRINVTPERDTNAVGNAHRFTVTIEKNPSLDGTTWVPVDAAYGSGPGQFEVVWSGVDATVDTSPNGDAQDCDQGTGSDGICYVDVTATEPGAGTLTATYYTAYQFTTGSPAVDPTNQTSTAASISDGGAKEWRGYTIDVDQDATNLLGASHTFDVSVSEVGPNADTSPEGVVVVTDWDGPTGSTVTGDGTSLPLADGTNGDAACTTDADGDCSFTVTSPDGPSSGILTVTAVSGSINGESLTVTSFGDGVDTDMQKTWKAYRLFVSPAEDINQVGWEHDFTVTVEETVDGTNWTPTAGAVFGDGPPSDHDDIDFSGALDEDDLTIDASNCLGGTDASGTCVISATSAVIGQTILTISGVTVPFDDDGDGNDDHLDVGDTALSAGNGLTGDDELTNSGQKTWVDYGLTIGDDGVNLLGDEHPFTVTVTRDDGTGSEALPGATVNLTWDGPAGSTIAPEGGSPYADEDADASNGIQFSCTTGGDGTCDFVVDSDDTTGEGTLSVRSIVDPSVTDPEEGTAGIDYEALVEAEDIDDLPSTSKTWIAVDLDISSDATNLTGEPHTFDVTATLFDGGANDLPAGSVLCVSISGDVGSVTGAAADGDGDPCEVGEYEITSTTDGEFDVVVESDDPGSLTVTLESVHFDYDGEGFSVTLTDGASGYLPDAESETSATKTWVAVDLDISDDSTNRVGGEHPFNVVATLFDGATNDLPAGSVLCVSISGDVGSVTGAAADGDGDPCEVGEYEITSTTDGEFDVVVESDDPGSLTVTLESVHFTWNSTAFSVDLAADADGYAPQAGSETSATKTWIDYALAISPQDATNLLHLDEDLSDPDHPMTVTLSSEGGASVAGQTIDLTLSSDNGAWIEAVDSDGDGVVEPLPADTTSTECVTTDAGLCHVVISAGTPGTATLSASYDFDTDDGEFTITSSEFQVTEEDPNGQDADKRWTTYSVTVEADAVNLLGTPHTFTVTVMQDGDNPVSEAIFLNGQPAEEDDDASYITISDPKDVASITGGTCFTTGTDEAGECTVMVNSTETTLATVTANYLGEAASSDSAFFTETGSKRWIDYRLDVDPDAADNLVDTDHVFTVTVEMDLGDEVGWQHVPDGSEVTLELAGLGAITDVGTGGTIGEGGLTGTCLTVDGTCSVTITSPDAGQSSLTAEFVGTAAGEEGNEDDTESATFTDEEGAAVKNWVDYFLDMSQDAVNPIGTTHTFTATLTVDTGEGFGPAGGEEVDFALSGPGTVVEVENGTVDADGRGGTCTTDTDGTCNIVITSNEQGETTVSASYFAEVGETTRTFPASAVKTWESNPAIDLIKDVDVTELPIGGIATYTYTITNTGDVTLTNVRLVDEVEVSGVFRELIELLGFDTTITLDPGESIDLTSFHLVTEDDLPGPIDNVATVTGEAPDGEEVSDTDDETVDPFGDPAIELDKVVAIDGADPEAATIGVDPDQPGDTVIPYEFTVTNTGNVTLTDVTLTDIVLTEIPAGGAPSYFEAQQVEGIVIAIELEDTTLAPAESTTGTLLYQVRAADVENSVVVNVAQVTGVDPAGTIVRDEDPASVSLVFPDEVEVKPQVVAKPAPVLPRTGFDTLQWALMAALVAGMGALLLLSTGEAQYARRRRD